MNIFGIPIYINAMDEFHFIFAIIALIVGGAFVLYLKARSAWRERKFRKAKRG